MPALPPSRLASPTSHTVPPFASSSPLHGTPTSGLASLALVDGLRELGPSARAVGRALTELTGLAPISLSVLQAVADGHRTEALVARAAGLDGATAAACLDGLTDEGLLEQQLRATPCPLQLTEPGRVRVAQVQALQVRVADAVLATVGPELGQSLAAVVAAVARCLTEAGGAPRLTRTEGPQR